DTRINHDVVQGEFESYSPDEFAVDRLGIWLTGGSKPRVIDRKAWDAAGIPASAVPTDGTVAYGVKFSPAGDRYGDGVALLSVVRFFRLVVGTGVGVGCWWMMWCMLRRCRLSRWVLARRSLRSGWLTGGVIVRRLGLMVSLARRALMACCGVGVLRR